VAFAACPTGAGDDATRTAADVLSRHVVFEIESIDRLYLNLYVPELQRVGQNWQLVRG